MYYKTISNMCSDIENNLELFHNYDLVVGIPRSGMLPASIIALKLNISLCTLDEFVKNEKISHGSTGRFQSSFELPQQAKNVLIIDDSAQSGRSIQNVKSRVDDELIKNVTYAVIYSSPELEQSCIDFYIKEVPRPRVFEWNLFHHSILSSSCVDIDGVLCEDIDRRDDDDGERYVDLIMQVKPKFIPTKTIDTLVTNRLEKYRDITEAWLKKHNINYNSLVMNPCATAEERREKNNYISHKSNAFKKSGNLLFIESDIKQAAGIAKETGYSVICTDTNEILHPNYYSRVSSVSGIKANIKMRLLKSKLFMRIYRKICR